MSNDLWIDTDQNGLILDWSPDALPLLGYSAKWARFRSLVVSLSVGRPAPAHLARVVQLGQPFEAVGTIRPRDQRGIAVYYWIALAPESSDQRPVLRWRFEQLFHRCEMVVWREPPWRCEMWVMESGSVLRVYERVGADDQLLAEEAMRKGEGFIQANELHRFVRK